MGVMPATPKWVGRCLHRQDTGGLPKVVTPWVGSNTPIELLGSLGPGSKNTEDDPDAQTTEVSRL